MTGIFLGGKVTPPASSIIPYLKESYVSFPLNFVFSYSNLAVDLLGLMIEEVSGEDFVTYTEKNLLNPLGMTNSYFMVKPQTLVSRGYYQGKPGRIQGPVINAGQASGSLCSNITDLSKFEMMVFAEGRSGTNRILKPETLHEMLTVQNADVPMDFDFHMGLSWFLYDYFGLPKAAGVVASHGGNHIYINTMLSILPQHKLGVIIITNSMEGRQILNDISGQALKMLLEAKIGHIEEDKPPRFSGAVTLPEDELKKHVGTYDSPYMGGIFKIWLKNGRLTTDMSKGTIEKLPKTKMILVPHKNGELTPALEIFGFIKVDLDKLPWPKLPATIIHRYIEARDISGHHILVVKERGKDNQRLMGVKINPVAIPDSWMKRTGKYEVTNKGEDLLYSKSLELKLHESLLIAEFALGGFDNEGTELYAAIKPISDTEAIIMGIGRSRGETIFIEKQGPDELIGYRGYSFRKK